MFYEMVSAHPTFKPPLATFDLEEEVKVAVATTGSAGKADAKKKGRKPK